MYLFNFLVSLHFFAGVLVPFFTDWGGIKFSDVMLLQSVFVLAIVTLEVPTGAIADYMGRKMSLAAGAVALIGAAVLYSICPNFWVFVAAEIVFAAGVALLSGAEEAFIYDTLKQAGREELSKSILGRYGSMGMAGLFVAPPIGSVIAHYAGLRYTMMAFTVPALLATVIALTLREPQAPARGRTRYLELVTRGFRHLRTTRPLRFLVFDKISVHIFAFMLVWLWQPLLMELGVSIVYFGVLFSVLAGVQMPVLQSYERLERLVGGRKRYLVLSALLAGSCLVALGFVTWLPAVVALILIAAAFGLTRATLVANYMHKYIESENRATVMSLVSMADRLAFAFVYPLVGLVVDWSLSSGFLMVGSLVILTALASRVKEEHLLD